MPSKLSVWLNRKSGNLIPIIKIDPKDPLPGVKEILHVLPDDLRNEAGSALIRRAGGIESFLNTLPPDEKLKVGRWWQGYLARGGSE